MARPTLITIGRALDSSNHLRRKRNARRLILVLCSGLGLAGGMLFERYRSSSVLQKSEARHEMIIHSVRRAILSGCNEIQDVQDGQIILQSPNIPQECQPVNLSW